MTQNVSTSKLLIVGVFAAIAAVFLTGRILLERTVPAELTPEFPAKPPEEAPRATSGEAANEPPDNIAGAPSTTPAEELAGDPTDDAVATEPAGDPDVTPPTPDVESAPPPPEAPGILTGVAYDRAGRPAAGITVRLTRSSVEDEPTSRTAPTDGEGRFRVEDLPPGAWEVWTDPEAVAAEEGVPPEAAPLGIRSASATIESGVEAHVVLGTPAPPTIRVTGRITAAGLGVAGTLELLRSEGDPLAQTRSVTIDETGRFETELETPGAYFVAITPASSPGRGGAIERIVTIPDDDAFSLALELPPGRVSGIVLAADGTPAEDAEVRLRRRGPAFPPSPLGEGVVLGWTDAEGAFLLDHLEAGTYDLAARPAILETADAATPPPAIPLPAIRGRIGGVIVGEVPVAGIELRLQAGGEVATTIRDAAGAAVRGASVMLRDSDGGTVELYARGTSDAEGNLRLGPIPPGEYTARARGDGIASPASATFRVEAGATAGVALVVEPAATLLLHVTDADGTPRAARLLLVDEEGRAVPDRRTSSNPPPRSAAVSALPHRRGALLPGTYTIRVYGEEGAVREESITLEAGETREHTLVL